LLDADVVGQRAPEPLRRNVVGLLDHTLTVAASRRTGLDCDTVVLGHGRERCAHLAGLGADHGGHPVEAPVPGQPTQGVADPVHPVNQMRLVLGLAQDAAPAPGVRERTNQQVRVLAPAPVLGRVGQLDPVPLGLRPGRVLDHRNRPVLGRPARLTRRPQPAGSQLAGHRRVRAVIAEPEQLVEQRRRPQVRIIGEALSAVRRKGIERISPTTGPNPSLPPGQVGTDGPAVFTQMPGDRGDRPTLAAQRVHVDVVLPCEHERRGSLELVCGQRPSASRGSRLSRRSHAGGDFQ